MVKVSITLPNAAQITLESEESEVIQQVISMALLDLPRELMQSSAWPVSGNGPAETVPETAHGSSGVANDAADRTSARPSVNVVQEAGVSIVETTSGLVSGPAAATPGQPRTSRVAVSREPGNRGRRGTGAATRVPTTESHKQFAQFCAIASPLGDMRKVVVAAEGAKRFLDMPSVDVTNLAELFDLAGWPIPHNFTQTLRNAARDKYRWLERVPGRSGRYLATQLGRTVTGTE